MQQEELVKRFHPNPVNNLYRNAVNGRLSRREVMKRGTALGLSSALMGTMLRAESIGAQATPESGQPLGYTIPDAETLQSELQLSTDFAGTQLNIVLGADGPNSPYEQALVDRFNEITGMEATYVRGSSQATDRLSLYLQTMAAQSPDIDAAEIDVIWPGIMAAHSVDLSDILQEGHFDRIVQNNTVNDVLVGIPYFTDAGLLYSRTDLLEEYGFEGPPETWDQLEEYAMTITEGEIADTPEFTGFVWQGNAYEGLTCNALEWQVSQGGGEIIDPDSGEVTVNNENAIAAFTRAAGWVGGISPTAVTGYTEEDSRAPWQGGAAAFMRNWPYAYALGQEEGSVIQDLFSVGQLPSSEGEDSAACLGGWQMFVSAYSENPEAATEWARYASSVPIQRSRAIEVAALPTYGELYTDPDVLAAQPYYEELFPVFSEASVPRPSTVSADFYNDVSIAYFTAVSQILGGGDAASIVEDLQADLEDIMSEV
jgi:trehalose/maltose transport system substrate-binding protein